MDDVFEKAKKRAPKFTQEEKIFLIQIMHEFKHIIENPKTDGPMPATKENAWKQLHGKFTEQSKQAGLIKNRTVKQLQAQWKNMKQRTRKADSLEHQYQLGTGGGPPYNPAVNDDYNKEDEPIHDGVRSVMPHINSTVYNPFDSTAKDEQLAEQYRKQQLINDIDEAIEVIESNNNDAETPTCSSSHKIATTSKNEGERQINHSKKRTFSTAFEDKDEMTTTKRKLLTGNEIEATVRMQRQQKLTEQQDRLYNSKLKSTEYEEEYWRRKNEAARIELVIQERKLAALLETE